MFMAVPIHDCNGYLLMLPSIIFHCVMILRAQLYLVAYSYSASTNRPFHRTCEKFFYLLCKWIYHHRNKIVVSGIDKKIDRGRREKKKKKKLSKWSTFC